jgi:hypothetical protein
MENNYHTIEALPKSGFIDRVMEQDLELRNHEKDRVQ